MNQHNSNPKAANHMTHDLDSGVCFSIYINAHNRKNGNPSYTLNVQKIDITHGEHF